MKVLPVFYSDTATVEKTRDFWELFETHTRRKGGEGERWWGNSSIRTFSTKVRFHNQFLSGTADELWERLETTRREKGESVEEWGDRVSDLCESLDYPNPQMRCRLFRRGLRNKRILTTLDASSASDIPEACEWLMFKDIHRPSEEDDEFSVESPSKKGRDTPVLTSVDALAQHMKGFMQQQQQWQQQLIHNQWRSPRSPRDRGRVMSAVSTTVPATNGQAQPEGLRTRGIRMSDDKRAQDGAPVCDRCNYCGPGRVTFKRATATCWCFGPCPRRVRSSQKLQW
ncbi:hypothetical protein PInf_006095 [Phytophthora infestans]|nr:hypothetical protein PInf_006095 [Phytophthora infestans]